MSSAEKIIKKDLAAVNLRLPIEVVREIDKERSKRAGFLSRNQWFIEALEKILDLDQEKISH